MGKKLYKPTLEDWMAVFENRIRSINKLVLDLYNSTHKRELLIALQTVLMTFEAEAMEVQNLIEEQINGEKEEN